MTNDALAPDAGLREQITILFGGYRAEWLGSMVFDLFTAPEYLPELITARPCFLFGGRGTGKTTVLRGLSYEGQMALLPSDPSSWGYYGFYYRVNTNRVRAFEGPELEVHEWTRAFAHYVNLTLTEEVVRFLLWLLDHTSAPPTLPVQDLAYLADAMHIESAPDLETLASELKRSRVRFEAFINNVADGQPPPMSMLGQPLDLISQALLDQPFFRGKNFFFLIDEYENLSDYQQQVLNTLIKHAGTTYTFKVGVKDLGFRRRTTLNSDEQLISPADYERIDITARLQGKEFSEFARDVCNDRLGRVTHRDLATKGVIDLLPGPTEREEASLLGIEGHVRDIRMELRRTASDEQLQGFDTLTPLEAYLVGFWSRSQKRGTVDVLQEALSDRKAWRDRLANYQHAMLFTLRRRRRGLHKFYAGWDTFTHLADGNIRYLLQLVYEALLRGVDAEASLQETVSYEDQTRAAQEVGRKNLTELEGLAVNGAQVTRLVLGLGRIFQVMARQAEGHAPEVNQFTLADSPVTLDDDAALPDGELASVLEVLRTAVMHLALVRSAANKLPGSSGDTKEFDYSLHPIFAAFFEFSHRRKRRMVLHASDIVGIIQQPRAAIEMILSRSHRDPDEDLPEQLALFSPYFNAVP